MVSAARPEQASSDHRACENAAMSVAAARDGVVMDGTRFDQLAQRLARRPRSRRAALQAGGLGLIAPLLRRGELAAPSDVAGGELARAAGTPAAQSTPGACPAGPANEVFMDGAWLCRQRYALCTTAACQPSPHDPAVANCRCFVEDGYSIGFTSCRERTPVGKLVVSTFSTQNVTSRFRMIDRKSTRLNSS